jgi:hypothetical protein
MGRTVSIPRTTSWKTARSLSLSKPGVSMI